MEMLNELVALLSVNLTAIIAILVGGLLVLVGKKSKSSSLVGQGLALAVKNKDMLVKGIVKGLNMLISKSKKK